jgi:2-desacetyl-2-hydroxyethyl bacteriochlorophyllide A dehydrogenase
MLNRIRKTPAAEQSLNVVFTGRGRVELLAEPVRRPDRGHVLVRTSCSLISTGTEITCLERRFADGSHWDRWVSYPFRPGYCSIGIIEQVGKGVETLQPGDRVASHGGHGQYANVAEEDATVVPDGLPDEEAAWFTIACIVQIAFRRAPIAPDDTVVVLGAGILGQLAVQYARRAGAARVVAVARSQPRLDVAAAHGATDTHALEAADAVTKIRELTGKGAKIVFDMTGNARVLEDAVRMVGPGGTVVLVGDTGFPEEQRMPADLLLKGAQLAGAHFDNASPREHAQMAREFFAAVQSRGIRVGDLITNRVDPRDAADAYARLSTDASSTIGVVFDWTRL